MFVHLLRKSTLARRCGRVLLGRVRAENLIQRCGNIVGETRAFNLVFVINLFDIYFENKFQNFTHQRGGIENKNNNLQWLDGIQVQLEVRQHSPIDKQ